MPPHAVPVPCLCHHMQVPGTQYAAMYMCATSSGACIRSSARSAGSRSSAGEATAVQSESEDAQTTAAAVRRKSVRVLRTHAGLQLRGGTSMHSDARALPRRRVTRSGCGMSRFTTTSKFESAVLGTWGGRKSETENRTYVTYKICPHTPCHHGAQNLGPGKPRVWDASRSPLSRVPAPARRAHAVPPSAVPRALSGHDKLLHPSNDRCAVQSATVRAETLRLPSNYRCEMHGAVRAVRAV